RRPRPRPDGQEAALLLRDLRRPLLRLRDQGAPPDPRLRAAHRPRGPLALFELQARAASTLDLPGRAHAASRPSPRLPSRLARDHPALLGRGLRWLRRAGRALGGGTRGSAPGAPSAGRRAAGPVWPAPRPPSWPRVCPQALPPALPP